MGLGSSPRRSAAKNWRRLFELIGELSADVVLLNEANVPLPKLPDSFQSLYDSTGTTGRDLRRDGRPVSRRWATAILSRYGAPAPVVARAKSRYGRRPNIQFGPSRPGSWVAGVVEDPQLGSIACVSLYGLLEELSDASVHRSLSDISPIFTDPDYKRLVLIGGDLNTSTQWPDPSARRRDEGVLRRFEDYGLIDCLRQTHEDAPLDNCRCNLGQDCRHTWTRRDPGNPHKPYQMDYLFASGTLAKRLETCLALPPTDWAEYSDHSPIIATFE